MLDACYCDGGRVVSERALGIHVIEEFNNVDAQHMSCERILSVSAVVVCDTTTTRESRLRLRVAVNGERFQ